LAEAKDWLRDRFKDGEVSDCPCCAQTVKRYKRTLNAAMARVLLAIYKESPEGRWVYVPRLIETLNVPKGGDYAKMRFWGLIESRNDVEGDVREDGSKRVGWWRITEAGVTFAQNAARLPKYLYTYNNDVVKREPTPTINIYEALGEKFDYAGIMAA
jgi:hypothetical protein